MYLISVRDHSLLGVTSDEAHKASGLEVAFSWQESRKVELNSARCHPGDRRLRATCKGRNTLATSISRNQIVTEAHLLPVGVTDPRIFQ